jgi:hypothetical protein
MADAEAIVVVHHLGGLFETKSTMQLQPCRGA